MNELKWVNPNELKENPKNRNVHTDEQIARLSQLITYQGWRWPIIVSNQSGFIMAGHGRVLAAKRLGLETVPVSYQDFTTEEQAYAFLVSDNAIASWSELDLAGINSDIVDLGPDFDIEMLGIKEFELDTQQKLPNRKLLECPHCHEQFEQHQAKSVDA